MAFLFHDGGDHKTMFWSNITMKLFGTTVFIVGLKKTDNGRTCSRHLFCGSIVAKGMEVVFWHCIVNCGGGPDEPGIAIHAISNGVQGFPVWFLSQDLAYCDSFTKNYEGKHAIVVTVFSLDKIKRDPSSSHWRMVHANYWCAEAMIISHNNDFPTKRAIEVYNSSPEKKIKRKKRAESDDEDKTAAV